jgi:hypothetical protein
MERVTPIKFISRKTFAFPAHYRSTSTPCSYFIHLPQTLHNRGNSATRILWYEEISKIFRTDAVKFINLTTKCVWKLSTSTQLRVTWHTDSLDMVVLPETGASRYHNCCIYGGTSPEYFGYTLVLRSNCANMKMKALQRHLLLLERAEPKLISLYVALHDAYFSWILK